MPIPEHTKAPATEHWAHCILTAEGPTSLFQCCKCGLAVGRREVNREPSCPRCGNVRTRKSDPELRERYSDENARQRERLDKELLT